VLGRVVVGWAPLPESVPEGACAAGVFAGVGLDAVPLVCAQTPAANASANPDRTASLKPMRSVALMTSPPPRWVPAHLPRFARSLRRKYLLFWHQWEARFLPQAPSRPGFLPGIAGVPSEESTLRSSWEGVGQFQTVLKGHEFTRAVNATKRTRSLSP
jgi:hypothetical protein